MSAAPDWDVIVVGAGHNGLAATALLAKRGLRVLCLEKNGYAGGMAGTREILSGCRNDVGASLLFPLAKGIVEARGREAERDLRLAGAPRAPHLVPGKGQGFSMVRVPAGLDDGMSQLWTQDSDGIKGTAEAGDGFGLSLAAGDFDGDGDDDLAVGVPAEDVGSLYDAGVIHEILGAGAGLDDAGDEDWDQDS